MADITKLRAFLDAYGVAVRAGVLTPNLDDEIAVRKQMGLPEANDAVRSSWAKSDGSRAPITLAKEVQDADGGTPV